VTKTLDTNSDVAFAITADSGELEIQADILVRSIRENYPTAPILVFIPESSATAMSENVLKQFRSMATVVLGTIPIPEYPISALIQAFVEAEKRFESKYLVALDTDTIILDHICISDNADVWLRPVDVGAQYWGSKKSKDDWIDLFRRFNYHSPDQFMQLTASVDHRPIPPYWNSGVVVTTDKSLASRWLRYTGILYNEDELPVLTDDFFIDQISLALAVQENEVAQLTERENFPLGGRILVPQDVAVLHYGDHRNLIRVIQPEIRKKLSQMNSIPKFNLLDLSHSLLDVLSTKSGLILSYEQKKKLRSVLKSKFT
jgi:hypothetical protein